MDYVQILEGLLPWAFGGGLGTITVFYGWKLLKIRLYGLVREFGAMFIAELLADTVEHPEKLAPVVDSLMKTFLNRPGGIIPKEATVRVPILGKVPASWFEPLVKRGIEQLGKMGTETVKEKVKHPFAE